MLQAIKCIGLSCC